MSEDNLMNKESEIWARAVNTYLSTLISDDAKSQAQRLFSMVSAVRSSGDDYTVMVRNQFASDMLNHDYCTPLASCISLICARPGAIKLSFEVDKSVNNEIIIPKEEGERQKSKTSKISTFISTMPLKVEYTFDEFVQGPSNSWAYAAANGVVKHCGEKGYNPLFIHGGTGLGKTHLMQAIGNELKKINPAMAICYLTAETFLNEYVNALQNKGLESFRDKYRKVDLLLVDDVQFLQKGKQCQEEFFNTFNALIDKQKQVVMTSDVAPKDLSVLESRLISRFEGGMVQEIESPAVETRLAILRKKAEGINPPMPDSALQFIAEHIRSHVRAMEGALGKVKIMYMLNPNIDLTSDMLTRLLKDFMEKEKIQRNITIDEIQSTVASTYGVTISQIVSTEKTAFLVTPRQLAMYITKKYTDKSLTEMVAKFNKSHATIIHGVKTIARRLDVEPELKHNLKKITSTLGLSIDDNIDR